MFWLRAKCLRTDPASQMHGGISPVGTYLVHSFRTTANFVSLESELEYSLLSSTWNPEDMESKEVMC